MKEGRYEIFLDFCLGRGWPAFPLLCLETGSGHFLLLLTCSLPYLSAVTAAEAEPLLLIYTSFEKMPIYGLMQNLYILLDHFTWCLSSTCSSVLKLSCTGQCALGSTPEQSSPARGSVLWGALWTLTWALLISVCHLLAQSIIFIAIIYSKLTKWVSVLK